MHTKVRDCTFPYSGFQLSRKVMSDIIAIGNDIIHFFEIFEFQRCFRVLYNLKDFIENGFFILGIYY